jgi:hypothetical protein
MLRQNPSYASPAVTTRGGLHGNDGPKLRVLGCRVDDPVNWNALNLDHEPSGRHLLYRRVKTITSKGGLVHPCPSGLYLSSTSRFFMTKPAQLLHNAELTRREIYLSKSQPENLLVPVAGLKMRIPRVIVPIALVGLVTADAVNDLEASGRPALDAIISQSSTCSSEKLEVRREWYVRLDECVTRPITSPQYHDVLRKNITSGELKKCKTDTAFLGAI